MYLLLISLFVFCKFILMVIICYYIDRGVIVIKVFVNLFISDFE